MSMKLEKRDEPGVLGKESLAFWSNTVAVDSTVLSDSVEESLTSRQIMGTGLEGREEGEDFLEGESGEGSSVKRGQWMFTY